MGTGRIDHLGCGIEVAGAVLTGPEGGTGILRGRGEDTGL